ncbi:hypothetical protein TNCV_2770051 [Trichonephila clavipes]|nr:hypothetical protein TNCV_2770051 [Trichonephila clavipes]
MYSSTLSIEIISDVEFSRRLVESKSDKLKQVKSPLNSKTKTIAGEKQLDSAPGTKQLDSKGGNNSTRQQERNNSTAHCRRPPATAYNHLHRPLMPSPPNALIVHTEYVLVESVGPKVLWAESREQGIGENFFLYLSFMPKLGRWRYMAASSIVMFYRLFGNFTDLNRTVTCMVLKATANDRRTSSPLPR